MDFKVPEMSCGHCTAAIEKAIIAADPLATVNCDLGSHSVTVESALAIADVSTAIKDAGYDSEAIAA